MSLLFVLLCAAFAVLFIFYIISTRKYNYWKKKKVPHLKPKPFVGNYGENLLLKKNLGLTAMDICKKFPKEPIIGAYYGTEPTLIVQDPEVLKLVMTKDYYYFSSKEVSAHTHKETFTQSLFFTYGNQWKILRQTLTPLFSSAKMKKMFYLIEDCSKEFERILDQNISQNNNLELKLTMASFTMDCIGTCIFGVKTKSMENTETNPFMRIGKAILEVSRTRGIKTNARSIWPSFFYGLKQKLVSNEVDSFFTNLLNTVFQSRESTKQVKHDFIDLLLELKKNPHVSGDKLENMKNGGKEKAFLDIKHELLISQSMAFFAAGYDTSALTMSMTLYHLAKSPDIQKRVCDEIDAFLKGKNNKLVYECTSELPYLDACVSEAMRMYPVLGVLLREIYDDYVMPSGLRLERGLRVHIPVHHLHYNPEFFPEPETFKPERFLPENKHNIIPYTYMPFGEGPRFCIGKRFAKMQMMAGLITLLKKYRLEVADSMPEKLEFEPTALVTTVKGPLLVKATAREGWEDRVYA